MSKIVLRQMEESPFCDKIRRVLHFKRLPYEAANVGTFAIGDSSRTGKVPSLEHRDTLIEDSTVIARHLESAFPDAPALLPTDPRDAALVDILEDWADEALFWLEYRARFNLYPDVSRRCVNKLFAAETGVAKAILPGMMPRLVAFAQHWQGVGRKTEAEVLDDIRRAANAIDQLLAGSDFLVGSSLTLADISVFAMVRCFLQVPVCITIFIDHPRVLHWFHRVDGLTSASTRTATTEFQPPPKKSSATSGLALGGLVLGAAVIAAKYLWH